MTCHVTWSRPSTHSERSRVWVSSGERGREEAGRGEEERRERAGRWCAGSLTPHGCRGDAHITSCIIHDIEQQSLGMMGFYKDATVTVIPAPAGDPLQSPCDSSDH